MATIFKGRWESIDALRGVAALGVVFYHFLGVTPAGEGPIVPRLTAILQAITSLGFVGVFLFFVISGFCIHLRWAKAKAAGNVPDVAFVAFWKKRWWRLYPPYLIALGLYLGLAASRGHLTYNGAFFYDLFMHLTMLHNLDKSTVYTLNTVFWTLAIEEQLYLAYFLLLALRTRLGWGWTLAICLATRAAWQFFGKSIAPQYLGWEVPVSESALMYWFTWALGALSVEGVLGLVKLPEWSRRWQSGVALAIVSLTCEQSLSTVFAYSPRLYEVLWFLTPPLWGLTFFCIINYFVHAEREWVRKDAIPSYIKGFATVGLFSYSLYLIHEWVLLQAYHFEIVRAPWLVITLFVTIPLAVACAWVFFLFAEKPFIRK